MSFVLEDIKCIEEKVSQLKNLILVKGFWGLSFGLYIFELGLFSTVMNLSKNVKLVIEIFFALFVVTTILLCILRRRLVNKNVVKTDEKLINEFCDFLKDKGMYSKPLLDKYASMEKQKVDAVIKENNGIFAMLGGTFVLWVSISASSILSKYQNTRLWIDLIAISFILFILLFSVVPLIKLGGDYFFTLSLRKSNETLTLLNEVDARIIKEQENAKNAASVAIHHPRKGY